MDNDRGPWIEVGKDDEVRILTNNSNITALVPGKSDAQLAAEFKLQIVEAYEPILAVLGEITKAGFVAQIQVGPDAFGKPHITVLQIYKNY